MFRELNLTSAKFNICFMVVYAFSRKFLLTSIAFEAKFCLDHIENRT